MFNFSLNIKTETGRELIASFSMSVNQKDRIALIGEEGNGKSLTLKALAGRDEIQNLQVTKTMSKPSLVFGSLNQELNQNELDTDALSYIISDQWDLYGSLGRIIKDVLPTLGIEDLDRPLHSFGGGERVRLQIMRLMLHPCDCYLLDEPSNDLDLETLEWLESWMLSQTTPIMFVSHDPVLLRRCATRIVHLEQTHRKTRSTVTVFEGTYDAYTNLYLHHHDTHNHAVKMQQQEKQKQEDRWRQLYQKVEHRQRTQTRQDPAKGRLLKKKMHNIKSMERRFNREVIPEKLDSESAIKLTFPTQSPVHRKKILKFECETLQIEQRILVRGIHLEVYSTDRIAIVGRNGVGKTTLIHKLIHALEGEVGVMHQSYEKNICFDLTPIENCVQQGSREERGLITNHLGSLKFTETEMNTPMHLLSGGQKAKVSLLKLVLQNPKVLILDEPTRNLSPMSVAAVYELLNRFEGAIIAVTHDRMLLEVVFETIYELTETGLTEMG